MKVLVIIFISFPHYKYITNINNGGLGMKKYFSLMIIIGIFLSACNNKNEEKTSDKVQVDKNLTNVEITLPASLVGEQNFSEIQEEAKENGVKEVIQNDDGSVTYKMSKKAHKKMMAEIEEDLKDTLDDIKNDKDYPTIKDVKYNNDFDQFTLIVDKNAYENSFDGFAALAIGISSMYYQLFKGVDTEDNKVTISIEDAATGEVIDTIHYPEALDE